MPAEDVAVRARRARWVLGARRARELVGQEAARFGGLGELNWCDYEESSRLTAEVRVVARDDGRVIQKWRGGVGPADLLDAERIPAAAAGHLLLMDHAAAGWARVSLRSSLPSLVRWAQQSMTDGFTVFLADGASSAGFDVETGSPGERWIETTLIGDGFGWLREMFGDGPPKETVAASR